MNKTHNHTCRVYYEDTDSGGIVYHASYLKFAERGRTEFLRAAGFDHASLREQQKIVFAVTEMNIQFKSAAKLDDLLTVHTGIENMSGARVEMYQKITYQDGTESCELRVTLATLDTHSLRAVRIPDKVKTSFGQLIKE